MSERAGGLSEPRATDHALSARQCPRATGESFLAIHYNDRSVKGIGCEKDVVVKRQ